MGVRDNEVSTGGSSIEIYESFLDGWMLGRWAEGAGCRNDEIMEQEVAVCSKLYAARALRRGANNGATREVRVTIYPCNVALQMQ